MDNVLKRFEESGEVSEHDEYAIREELAYLADEDFVCDMLRVERFKDGLNKRIRLTTAGIRLNCDVSHNSKTPPSDEVMVYLIMQNGTAVAREQARECYNTIEKKFVDQLPISELNADVIAILKEYVLRAVTEFAELDERFVLAYVIREFYDVYEQFFTKPVLAVLVGCDPGTKIFAKSVLKCMLHEIYRDRIRAESETGAKTINSF